MKKLIILLNVFLLTSSLLLLSGCVEPIMSCAGIKTSYPRCAKFCTHDAVATCESQCKQLLGQACNLYCVIDLPHLILHRDKDTSK